MLSQQVCLCNDEIPFTHTHTHLRRSAYTTTKKCTHKHTHTLADQAHTHTHAYTCCYSYAQASHISIFTKDWPGELVIQSLRKWPIQKKNIDTLAHTHTHTHMSLDMDLSLSLSLSHTHTHEHTHTHSLFGAQSLPLFFWTTHCTLDCECAHRNACMCTCIYGVATISRLLKIICLFCKRAL